MQSSSSPSSTRSISSERIHTRINDGPSLPFEIWRTILQDVFATKSNISHPPDYAYTLSPLHARYNVLKSLIVCKYWFRIALDVFFEDLQAETADSLEGINKALTQKPHLVTSVSRISLSFPRFRDTASDPRRPLILKRPSRSRSNSPPWNSYHQSVRRNQQYSPSNTRQGSHWQKWQGLCRLILARCTALMDITITFTGDYSTQNMARTGRDYRTLFPPPDLRMESILDGLRAATNLRSMQLIDPSPLAAYGPALANWKRLKEASIELTRAFPEFKSLPETSFCPPKSLQSFRFHDAQSYQITSWPLSSDLATCTDLTTLDLSVSTLSAENTVLAIGYLVQAYQHTLRTLILTVDSSGGLQSAPGSFEGMFQNLAEQQSPLPGTGWTQLGLHFTQLETLRLPKAHYHNSLFSSFRADKLAHLQVGGLDMEVIGGNGNVVEAVPTFGGVALYSEEYWRKALSHRSLHHLKRLEVTTVGELRTPRATNSLTSLEAACRALDIQLDYGSHIGVEEE